MTVYEMIQKLAAYPPDCELVVVRVGAKRGMTPCSVSRWGTGKPSHDDEITVLVDWREDPKP